MEHQSKPKVLVTRPLPDNQFTSAPLRQFCDKFEVTLGPTDKPLPRDEILRLIPDMDALICHSRDKADAELIARGSKLRVISNFGAGYDTVDVGAATERGIWVCNTPGAVTNATADVALYLLLGACRRTSEAEQFLRSGDWARAGGTDVLAFWGNNPEGKTLGIIGMGSIGQALARRARALDMRVVYHNRNRLPEDLEQGAHFRPSLPALLAESDFVSIHTPLTDATRHILGREQFAQMKKGAYVINTARGPVIDEQAMVDALRDGTIRGAGLDVFEREPQVHPDLLTFPSVTLLPHIGTATIEARSDMFLLQLENVTAVLEGRSPPNPVNKVCA